VKHTVAPSNTVSTILGSRFSSYGLFVPQVAHFLRSTRCFGSTFLQSLDDIQKRTLSSLTIVDFVNLSWIQDTLPVHWGGLGVRSVVDLTSSCLFRNLVISILAPSALIGFDNSFCLALQGWESQGGVSIPSGLLRSLQSAWDDEVYAEIASPTVRFHGNKSRTNACSVPVPHLHLDHSYMLL